MANIYVRSADGNNADDGSTWALAKATLVGADGIDAAGDTIFVSDAHSESTAGAVSLSFAGTITAPTRVICGDDVAEPPTAVTTTGLIANSTAAAITLNATSFVQFYGLTFKTTQNSSGAVIITVSGAGYSYFERCEFWILGNGGTASIQLGQTSTGHNRLKNCGASFGVAGQQIIAAGSVHWDGGTFFANAAFIPTTIFTDASAGTFLIENLDLSAGSTTMNLCGSTRQNVRWMFRNCRLPASWAGALNASTPGQGSMFELIRCSAGAVNYAYSRMTSFGTLTHETTIVRTGSTTDGTTNVAWKIVTTANCVQFPLEAFWCPDISVWCDTTGSAKTVTVGIVHDSVTALTDAEVFADVVYLGSSAAPLGTALSDAKASVLATAANQTASSLTWTTTGLTNPNKQELAVTFTPNMKGPYVVRVGVVKASYTLYVDPDPVES